MGKKGLKICKERKDKWKGLQRQTKKENHGQFKVMECHSHCTDRKHQGLR